MKNEKIEQHIYRAVDKAPIDLLSSIKSQHVDKMESHDFITRQDTKQDSKPYWKPFMALSSMAAVFLIVFIGWWSQYNPVDSVIYLDVNPSFEVSIDKNEKVVGMKMLKTEDEALIANIDYKNKDLYLVAEQLLDVLIAEGYIDISHHTMLVSVLNNDIEIGSKQSAQLNSSIRDYLQKQSIQGIVLRQAITKSNTIEEFARNFQISVGKMTFIRNLIILNPDLKVEELTALSLEELVRLSGKTGLDLKRIIEVDQELDELYQDVDDDDDFDDDGTLPLQLIGHEKAIAIAMGLTGGGVVVDIELDEDDGRYIYEIEIVKDWMEYDIQIDAMTGKLLEFKSDDNYDDENDNDENDNDDNDDDYDDFEDGTAPVEIIGHEKAIEIAMGLTGGGEVVDIELDEDDGRYIYEIVIAKDGMEYDIVLEAYSGKILMFEIDN